MRSSDRKILIGKLGKPHGIKGYVYFHYYGQDLSNLQIYENLQIQDHGSFKLDRVQQKANRLIIKLAGFNDRNLVENLRNKEVYINETDLPSLDEGEYYLYQLEGLVVKNLENRTLGMVKRTFGTKSNEVLVIESTEDSVDDEERLMPYVKPEVIKEINLDEGLILVDWPESY